MSSTEDWGRLHRKAKISENHHDLPHVVDDVVLDHPVFGFDGVENVEGDVEVLQIVLELPNLQLDFVLPFGLLNRS